MGMMVEGAWQDVPRVSKSTGGAFIRPESAFRNWVSDVDAGRYQLYVARSCPWAHRTLVVRALKGLEKAIPVFYAGPSMGENGWEYATGEFRFLHQLYARAKPDYTGRVTVPILLDKRSCKIVNNESREILRMLETMRGDRQSLARTKQSIDDLRPVLAVIPAVAIVRQRAAAAFEVR